jgi:hypothetical protein
MAALLDDENQLKPVLGALRWRVASPPGMPIGADDDGDFF